MSDLIKQIEELTLRCDSSTLLPVILQVEQLIKERDKANSLVRRILSEINCRIEHGADSNGHLEGLHGLYKKETP